MTTAHSSSGTNEYAAGALLGGRYRLGAPLGEGGMGVVLAAVDERLGREVAVKVLEGRLSSTEDQTRFHREARLLARLSHPNIVGVYDVVLDAQRPYLVMERLLGDDVLTRAERVQSRVELAVQVGRQVASALGVMHRAGIVHRDLKPENVLCIGEGAHLTAKLIDFGIAIDDGPGPRVTSHNAIMGTPAYLAPERLRGQVSPAADIFGLGVLLYEVLTGALPFDGDTVAEVLYQVTSATPLPVSHRALARHADERGAASPLFQLVDRMIARDPLDRPSLADVGAILAGVEEQLSRVVEVQAVAVIGGGNDERIRALTALVTSTGGTLERDARGLAWLRFGTTRDALPALRHAAEHDLRAALHTGPVAPGGANLSAADDVAGWLLRYAVPGEVLLSEAARDELGPAGRADCRLHGGYDDGAGQVAQVYTLVGTGDVRSATATGRGELVHGAVRCACGACQALPQGGAPRGGRVVCSRCSYPIVVDARAITESIGDCPGGACRPLAPPPTVDIEHPLLDELANL